jgi:hypothetical protein
MDLARGGARKPRAVDGGLVPAVSDSTSTFASALSNSSSAFCNLLSIFTAFGASNRTRIHAHATVAIVTWSSPWISTRLVCCAHISDLARSLALSDHRRSTLECAHTAATPFDHRRRSLISSYKNNFTIESPNTSFVTIIIIITPTNSREWSCPQAAEGLPPLQQIARHLPPAMSLLRNPSQLLIHRVRPSTTRLCH